MELIAVVGGAIVYAAFSKLTGLDESLIGIPVGLLVGQCMFIASLRMGGHRFQILAVFLAFLAFDLTYAPGMAEISFKGGTTAPAFVFFLFMTAVSPVIDHQNGFLGQFMVLGGMYLAWTIARPRTAS